MDNTLQIGFDLFDEMIRVFSAQVCQSAHLLSEIADLHCLLACLICLSRLVDAIPSIGQLIIVLSDLFQPGLKLFYILSECHRLFRFGLFGLHLVDHRPASIVLISWHGSPHSPLMRSDNLATSLAMDVSTSIDYTISQIHAHFIGKGEGGLTAAIECTKLISS